MEKSNLWILTEERPKNTVLGTIIQKFASDHSIACFINNIRILPILNKDKTFSFVYEVKGLDSKVVKKIYIKTVSGFSSFVDFLVFYQEHEPKSKDTPIYAIEETKTDDSESRNTGVYQRATKFVYVDYYYPNIKKIMLYNLQIEQKDTPTDTNIFGTRCLITLGVEILGKEIDQGIMKPYKTVDEIIKAKNSMRQPPAGNVSVRIAKKGNLIEVSGRLIKSGSIAHDPSIGTLSLICATLRSVGWKDDIEITQHGLSQNHVDARNKFIKIAARLNIGIQGLTITKPTEDEEYWKYDSNSEKLGTIFIHLVVENFTEGFSIFENHAGCEKGYFMTKEGKPIAVEKYSNKEKYKDGDKTQIVYIPDLILIDTHRIKVINVEGKKYENMEKGISELNNFDAIEKFYIKKYYPEYDITRTVVLYGGTKDKIERIEVGFLLNSKGQMVLSVKAPKLFQEAIGNLVAYWGLEGAAVTKSGEPAVQMGLAVEKSDLFLSDIIPDAKHKDGYLPVYDLEAVATAFAEQSTPAIKGWKPISDKRYLEKNMFIAQVVGKSMEPTIPDCSWCIFRFDRGGSRNGLIVLVESRQVTDPETNHKFTIKRYQSEKEKLEDGQWRHKKIVLSPDNKKFDDIILENVSGEDFRVVAEFIAVLGK